jgi:hypothetical protein
MKEGRDHFSFLIREKIWNNKHMIIDYKRRDNHFSCINRNKNTDEESPMMHL